MSQLNYKGKPVVLKKQSTVGILEFEHIYQVNAFDILKTKQRKRHACMEHGEFCTKQLEQQGRKALLAFLYSQGVKRPERYLI